MRDYAEALERLRGRPLERARLELASAAWRESMQQADRALVAEVQAMLAAQRRAELRQLLLSMSAYRAPYVAHYGNEDLDTFIELLFGTHSRYDGRRQSESELIHYDPSPASAVFELIDRLALTSEHTLVDIGAGIGRVPILVAALTGARSHGIELDETLVAVARDVAVRLEVPAEFLQGDARKMDLGRGDVFFFFAPFVGAPLAVMLDRLADEARRRRFLVAVFGPSLPAFLSASFLRVLDHPSHSSFTLQLFESL